MSSPGEFGGGQGLDRLLRAYRQACGEPEPSVNFMPELWSRIEQHRSTAFRLRRVAQVFVTAAAALSIFLAGLTRTSPQLRAPEVYQSTYLDVLAAQHVVEGGFPGPSSEEPSELDLL
jgi:hypothetical protein